jgi:hypothetical protein
MLQRHFAILKFSLMRMLKICHSPSGRNNSNSLIVFLLRPPQADFVYRFSTAFLLFRNRITDSDTSCSTATG